jgi:hypothetical protein
MPVDLDRLTPARLIELAARGLGKVDTLGPRGATLCSMEEIIAMAGMLDLLGLRAIRPGEPTPNPLQAFDLGDEFSTKG